MSITYQTMPTLLFIRNPVDSLRTEKNIAGIRFYELQGDNVCSFKRICIRRLQVYQNTRSDVKHHTIQRSKTSFYQGFFKLWLQYMLQPYILIIRSLQVSGPVATELCYQQYQPPTPAVPSEISNYLKPQKMAAIIAIKLFSFFFGVILK